MPKVRTRSLRRLANKSPQSILTGAINESADYIDELEESLRECMEAMRKNLVYAQIKDEKSLYEAYKNAEKILNQVKDE